MKNKELVLKAAGEPFGAKHPSVVDCWAAPDYCQHCALVGDGDLVALHGIYHGFGPELLAAFDLFRVADGKLAEHWDVITPIPAELLPVPRSGAGRTPPRGWRRFVMC